MCIPPIYIRCSIPLIIVRTVGLDLLASAIVSVIHVLTT
jgi:hypothetical protein